jgi:hypothetical protein
MRTKGVALLSALFQLQVAEAGLITRVRSEKDTFKVGEDVRLVIDVINVSEGTVWRIVPHIVPPVQGEACPYPELTILLTDSEEARIYPRPETNGWVDIAARMPTAESFRELLPGEQFGRTISVTKGQFSHGVLPRGKYHVRVRIRSTARKWLALAAKEGRAIGIEPTRVFDGSLESQTVSFRVE